MSEDVVAPGLPFTIASVASARYTQQLSPVSNLGAGGSFPIVSMAATGWVRRVELDFTATYTTSASAAVVAGDAPFNLVTGISVTDSSGAPIYQTFPGYGLYLANKYLQGTVANNNPSYTNDPVVGPRYAFAASSTSGSARFRLHLTFEKDAVTGYGCIPNVDSNASLQLKIDYAASSVAFTGGTASAATIGCVVKTHFYAPVASTMGGVAVSSAPVGAGDYSQMRIENQAILASTENLITHSNRGGMIRGTILVSRASGVRTAVTAGANFGLVLDNKPIIEGMPIEDLFEEMSRALGFVGAEINAYTTPSTVGLPTGLDRGVVPLLPYVFASPATRNSWLRTGTGSLLQTKFTPGSSATGLEIITELLQTRDFASFYGV